MAKKGSKFARRIYTRDESSIRKLCDFLEKYDPDTVMVLDDLYGFYGDYYVIGFRATKDEFSDIRQKLKLVYSQFMLRTIVKRGWVYEKEDK